MTGAVTLRADGRITADSATIAKLQRLCAEDAASLQPERTEPHTHSQLGDDVERTLIGLMAEVSAEARRSFRLAREAVVPGGEVEMRSIAVNDAYRLSKAFAMLTEALARHRGHVVEQRIVVIRPS